ncbi:hypothetical protein BJ912DRAFT_1149657 [Pholiota molesta]|nr:hypothetical protein BJ912DRAFT_1149657 [Pholiota molesta]
MAEITESKVCQPLYREEALLDVVVHVSSSRYERLVLGACLLRCILPISLTRAAAARRNDNAARCPGPCPQRAHTPQPTHPPPPPRPGPDYAARRPEARARCYRKRALEQPNCRVRAKASKVMGVSEGKGAWKVHLVAQLRPKFQSGPEIWEEEGTAIREGSDEEEGVVTREYSCGKEDLGLQASNHIPRVPNPRTAAPVLIPDARPLAVRTAPAGLPRNTAPPPCPSQNLEAILPPNSSLGERWSSSALIAL